MWFEIKACHKRSFLLCLVYRKPSELFEWIDKFEFELSNASSFNSDIVLTGDFSMNVLPFCKPSQQWLSIIEIYNLKRTN